MSMPQMGGLTGKILRVNLSSGVITTEDTNVDYFKKYIGARGVAAKLLLDEVAAGINPLGPDNKLIFMTGPAEGTMAPGANKITVTFKSPLTGTYSFALCGGSLGPELKFAGYDGIIIEGKAEKPSYLWIDGNKVELRSAEHLWGKLTHATEDALRAELKDHSVKLAVIGPAGENLNRFACIQHDYHREFGRGGCGAVMGSKNLKAIAVRGKNTVSVANQAALTELTQQVYDILARHPKANARKEQGTCEMVNGINELGFLAVRNFQDGASPLAVQVSGPEMRKNYVFGDVSCFACPIVCGKNCLVKSEKYGNIKIEGPEFETMALVATNTCVFDWEYILRAVDLIDQYGMDTITCGGTIALAMECYEKGIITDQETGGLALNFGNGEALCQLVEMIGRREGIGDLLAEGLKTAAEKLGVPELAMHSKGMSFAAYDPRGAKGMGLTYAVSTKGAHHMFAPTFGVELAQNNRFAEQGKGALVKETQAYMAIVDSMSLCSSMRFALSLGMQLDMIQAITGWKISEQEAMEIGDRIITLEKLFNIREGFGRKDDTLPPRMLKESPRVGPCQNQTINLETMLDEYYAVMGWDREGKPTPETLTRLELEEFINIVQS
ncbi:MAG: aldehyde ferredoxin oxidoreductase family protein [Desulfurispora sp.]|uniref:aldehyde ferredoxin oxidoreductase family protein n=1 Tax=Desulfurispora sp. TaxID=3014275 RepID=UPI00404A9A65